MSSGQITAIVIVAIIMLASIIKAGARSSHFHSVRADGKMDTENQRLREEVHELKERLKVLERIAVEKENSLAKEIESLRDR